MKILFHVEPSASVPRWRRLSDCVGIFGESEDVVEKGLLASVTTEFEAGKSPCILLDVDSLTEHTDENQLLELAALLARADASVLLLVGKCGESADRFVRVLTRGAVTQVTAARSDLVSFPPMSGKFSQELAGHSYARESGESLGLAIGAESAEVIMCVGQNPSFVCVPVGRARVFVWATLDVFDIDGTLREEREFEQASDGYIPAIIFLRSACGDLCWRSPWIGAGLVIDDPLLQRRYGFIDFRSLLDSARRHGYRVTLAFIPWNHWRGSSAKARMFREHADCFSLCVHGCDHTNREYGSPEYDDLLARNFQATRRMDRHCKRTGVPYEPMMVCPQELYSSEAMRAFADSRQFIGLVGTACMPRDLAKPQLRGADLLLPAQDSFHGVPVFKRHYWRDMAVFAMAVFLGKPAILVEHHEFFRDGPGGVERFATELAQLRPDARWMPLAETARRTHLRRRLSAQQHEVRFFTDDFEMETGRDGAGSYTFFRRVSPTASIVWVTVNGMPTEFLHRDGMLCFASALGGDQSVRVRMRIEPVQSRGLASRGIKYHTALALRRALSEFRDNVIARSDLALKVAKRVVKALNQTGGT